MTGFVIDLPEQLRAAVSEQAARRGVSAAAWLEEAAREKLAAEEQRAYLAARAARADRAAYTAVLDRVPANPPDPGDER